MDSVLSVERHSKRVLNLRMLLDNGLLNILTVYAIFVVGDGITTELVSKTKSI